MNSGQNEHPSTYVVQDRSSEEEMTRLTVQDRMVTAMMGGVLPEQPDPAIFRQVLDIGCGTGGWLIEMAHIFPMITRLVGVDSSARMINEARIQAKAVGVDDRVEFQAMDALRMLEFPENTFDLVNLRFGVSFLRTWDWAKMLREMQRITRPAGMVRLTEGEIGVASDTAPALLRLFAMLRCAFFRAGYLFQPTRTGIIDVLEALVRQYGYRDIQTQTTSLLYQAGTQECKDFYQDWMTGFRTLRPFLQKWGCADDDYDAIYQQALEEMVRPEFAATFDLLTVWGTK